MTLQRSVVRNVFVTSSSISKARIVFSDSEVKPFMGIQNDDLTLVLYFLIVAH